VEERGDNIVGVEEGKRRPRRGGGTGEVTWRRRREGGGLDVEEGRWPARGFGLEEGRRPAHDVGMEEGRRWRWRGGGGGEAAAYRRGRGGMIYGLRSKPQLLVLFLWRTRKGAPQNVLILWRTLSYASQK
jgi:hypothetical protein